VRAKVRGGNPGVCVGVALPHSTISL